MAILRVVELIQPDILVMGTRGGGQASVQCARHGERGR